MEETNTVVKNFDTHSQHYHIAIIKNKYIRRSIQSHFNYLIFFFSQKRRFKILLLNNYFYF